MFPEIEFWALSISLSLLVGRKVYPRAAKKSKSVGDATSEADRRPLKKQKGVELTTLTVSFVRNKPGSKEIAHGLPLSSGCPERRIAWPLEHLLLRNLSFEIIIFFNVVVGIFIFVVHQEEWNNWPFWHGKETVWLQSSFPHREQSIWFHCALSKSREKWVWLEFSFAIGAKEWIRFKGLFPKSSKQWIWFQISFSHLVKKRVWLQWLLSKSSE